MKVLFLTNIPSPYRVAFFRELSKKVELTVLYETEKASDRKAGWIKTDENSTKSYHEVYLKRVWTGGDQAFCPEVKKYLKRDFDAIIVGVYSTPTGMYAIRYMKSHHIPYFISCDGGMISSDSNLKHRIKNYFLSGAAGYFSSGQTTDEYLMHYGAEANRIHRYPFSSVSEYQVIDRVLTSEEKMEFRKKLGVPEEELLKPMICSVGQFIHRKGYDILFEAASMLPEEYRYYIIGDKQGEEYLQQIKELGLKNIHFVDFMPYAKLKEYYQAADLFVLPTREDIWGLVINEALANGLPVVTTDKCVAGVEFATTEKLTYGMRSVVSIVESENPEATANAIKTAIEKQDEIDRKRCIELARKYTIETMAEAYADIICRHKCAQ